MSVSVLHEIRILPGIAIARVGSSPSPMDNFETVANGEGFRRLKPAESLVVSPESGEIIDATVPKKVRFRDGQNRIRPVSPFLELWGRFDDNDYLRPITTTDLDDLGMSPSDIRWSIILGGLKIFRRTGDPGDRITAVRTADELASHRRLELEGKCPNFKTETTKITMGWIQYIRPNERFPEIRVRFTAPPGLVFGHREIPGIIPAERAVYDSEKGRWDTYEDQSPQQNNPTARSRLWTIPGRIYARSAPDPSGNRAQLGFFDDIGDAIVSVSMPGFESASARVAVGPPDFAPDSYPTRTIEDELLQMVGGPVPQTVTADEIIDIVRRAVETMRLMNTEVGNQNFLFWVRDQLPIFPDSSRVQFRQTRSRHENILKALSGLKSPPDHPDRLVAYGALKSIANILREYNRAADYDRNNMQRMPAMMRDASSHMLTLSRRQINCIRLALEMFKPLPPDSSNPTSILRSMIASFSWASSLHVNITTEDGGSLDTVFDDPDRVLEHLLSGTAQGKDAEQLGILGEKLVLAGDPEGSAIIKLVNKPDHAMNSQLINFRAPDGISNGIDVLTDWIEQL